MKNNSIFKQALGLLGGHFGGVVIALIIFLGLIGISGNIWGLLLVQLVSALGYGLPVYSAMWEFGHKDHNRANYGHMVRNQYRGFKIAAVAFIPFYIISVLFILSKFNLFYNIIVPYKVLNVEVWPLINMVAVTANISEYTVFQTIIVALLPLLPIPVAGVAYIMGDRDYSPLATLIYKNKKKKATEKQSNHKKSVR